MAEKPFVVRSHDIHLDKDYTKWLTEIKERYQSSQIKAAVKVNSEQLLFNWQLGRDLVVLRAEEKWGKGVVEQVSLDLKAAFPNSKGFSTSNLWYMKKWYQFYTSKPNPQKLQQLVGESSVTDSQLQQLGTQVYDEKLQQAVGEIGFPSAFAYVP